MARRDPLATRGDEGLGEVHFFVLEDGTQLLWALLKAVFSQEVHEGHVD